MAEAPAWARELVMTVCDEAGAAAPRLRWRHRARARSSGVTRVQAGSVSLNAGTDPVDQRVTLLHELAHWLAPRRPARRGRVRHHDADFYARAFRLHLRYGIPPEVAIAGEASRYPGALRHARALGIPGGEAAWLARRRDLRERARARPPLRVVVPEHRVRLVRDGRWSRCATCGVRVVGPVLRRIRRRGGSHVLLTR